MVFIIDQANNVTWKLQKNPDKRLPKEIKGDLLKINKSVLNESNIYICESASSRGISQVMYKLDKDAALNEFMFYMIGFLSKPNKDFEVYLSNYVKRGMLFKSKFLHLDNKLMRSIIKNR